MIPSVTGFDYPTYTLATNIPNGGYARIGRVPLTAAKKGCVVRVRGVVDATGTETDALVCVSAAYDPDTPGNPKFAISALSSHSTYVDVTTDPGIVLRYFRIGLNTTDGYAYLDVGLRKNPTVTIYISPIDSGDWEWMSGSTTTNVVSYSLTRTEWLFATLGLAANVLTATGSTTATYANSMYSGQTLSDSSDKTGKWAYFGLVTIDYNSSYLGGRSFNGEFRLKEISASKPASDLEDVVLHIGVQLGAHADSTTFNTLIPTIRLEFEGRTTLTGSDFAALVYSTTTGQKLIRLYVKLKGANSHYTVIQVTRYGGSYSSALGHTTGYVIASTASGQAVLASLPTPAQGSVVYGVPRTHAISDVSGLQAALDGKASLSGAAFTGPVTLPGYGTTTTRFVAGGTDGASYSNANVILEGWYGLAFKNPTGGGTYPNAITGYINFREGILDFRQLKSNGSPVVTTANVGSQIAGGAPWSGITGKPTTLAGYGITDAAPASHTHAISDVSGLQAALDGKAPSNHGHAWGSLTGTVTDQGDLADFVRNDPYFAGARLEESLSNYSDGFLWFDSQDQFWRVVPPYAHTHPSLASYDLNVTCGCKPTASQKLLVFVAPRAFRVAASGHQGKCYVHPTGSAVLTVKKNGVSIGTMTFSTSGVFSSSITQTDFAVGDVLTVEAPSAQNSTFADFGVTIAATVL